MFYIVFTLLKYFLFFSSLQNEKYQKRIKKLRGTLSKSRQDSSLKMFELKDENTKLAEENTKLQGTVIIFSYLKGEMMKSKEIGQER